MSSNDVDYDMVNLDCSTNQMLERLITFLPPTDLWDMVGVVDATVKDFAYPDEVLYEPGKPNGVIINSSEKGTFILITIAKK